MKTDWYKVVVLIALLALNVQWAGYHLRGTPDAIEQARTAAVINLQTRNEIAILLHENHQVRDNSVEVFKAFQDALRQNMQLRREVNTLSEVLDRIAAGLKDKGIDPAEFLKGCPTPAKPKPGKGDKTT